MKYSAKIIVLSLLVFVLALIIFFEILIYFAYYWDFLYDFLPDWKSLWEESPVLLIITILAVGFAIFTKNAKDTPSKKFSNIFIISFGIFCGLVAVLDGLFNDIFEMQYFLLFVTGILLLVYFSLSMRENYLYRREQKKVALPEETTIEENYFKRLLKPSKRKLISSVVLASILPLPYPCFVCFGGIEWGFIPFLFNALGTLLFGVLSPLIFFISPFSMYALLTYLLINLIDKKVPIAKSQSLIIFSVLVFIIMPILFTGIFIFNVGDLRESAVNDLSKVLNNIAPGGHIFYKWATKTNNPQVCEKLGDVYDKAICYYALFEKTGDIKFCEKIELSDYKDSCLKKANFKNSTFNSE